MATRMVPGALARIARHAARSAAGVESFGRCLGSGSAGSSLLSSSRVAAAQHGSSARLGAARGLMMSHMGSTAVMGHHMAAAAAAAAPPSTSFSTSTSSISSSGSQVSSAAGGAGGGSTALMGSDSDDESVLSGTRRRRTGQLMQPGPHQRLHLPPLHPSDQQLHEQPHQLPLLRSISCSAALGPAAAGAARSLTTTSAAAAAAPALASTATPDTDAASAFLLQHDIKVSAPPGVQAPDPVLSFDMAPFPARIMKEVRQAGYQQPTPIQAQAWPIASAGHDLVAIASTGSGKTVAYLLPALSAIHTGKMTAPQAAPAGHRHYPPLRPRGAPGPLVLVLAPTRELAHQIQEQAARFGRPLGIDSLAVYGGTDKNSQVRALRSTPPQVLVATPGRLLDLLESLVVSLDQVQYLVLDEADRMLDMGFEPDIRRIMQQVPQPPTRQTLFFSATWPKEVRSLAANIAGNDPVTVMIGNVTEQPVAARSIKQEVQLVEGGPRAKLDALQAYLQQVAQEHAAQQPGAPQTQGRHHHRQGSVRGEPLRVIVFVATKRMAESLEYWFDQHRGLPRAVFVHGDRTQVQRESALASFRAGGASILVATDVAARGLDIPHVTTVVNFDVPQASKSEDYVHRIGRTGRAGASGRSLALLDRGSANDAEFAHELIKIMRDAGQPVSAELEQFAASARHTRGGGYQNRGRSAGGAFGGRGGYGGGYGSGYGRGSAGSGFGRGSSGYGSGRSGSYGAGCSSGGYGSGGYGSGGYGGGGFGSRGAGAPHADHYPRGNVAPSPPRQNRSFDEDW